MKASDLPKKRAAIIQPRLRCSFNTNSPFYRDFGPINHCTENDGFCMGYVLKNDGFRAKSAEK